MMRDLWQWHAAYTNGIVLGIGHGLGSGLLFSRSPVNRSSEGDDQSTCRLIVIQSSSIVRIESTSKCCLIFSSGSSSECSSKCSSECSSETQTPVLCAVEVLEHALESYHMLSARVGIVPAENSNRICNIGPTGSHCVHLASDHRLVYGQIAGFFVGLPLVELHYHWCGNWSRLIQSGLCEVCPNVAVLMDVNSVMLRTVFDVHAEMERVVLATVPDQLFRSGSGSEPTPF